MSERAGIITAGLLLIGLGIVLFLAFTIGWAEMWPVFPLVAGLASLLAYAAGGFRDSGLVFLGTAATLVGLFFFGFTLGYWEWGDMADLWPVFALIGGVAFLALFLAERGRDVGTLGVGCAALVVGAVGLAVTLGLVGSGIVKLWPLLLVLIGIVSLVGGLARAFRQR